MDTAKEGSVGAEELRALPERTLSNAEEMVTVGGGAAATTVAGRATVEVAQGFKGAPIPTVKPVVEEEEEEEDAVAVVVVEDAKELVVVARAREEGVLTEEAEEGGIPPTSCDPASPVRKEEDEAARAEDTGGSFCVVMEMPAAPQYPPPGEVALGGEEVRVVDTPGVVDPPLRSATDRALVVATSAAPSAALPPPMPKEVPLGAMAAAPACTLPMAASRAAAAAGGKGVTG
jgi:hypothetical protein